MQIFKDDDAVSSIYQRAISLTISQDFAEQSNGKQMVAAQPESQQGSSQRELSAVEKKANKETIIKENGHSDFKIQLMSKLYAEVHKNINEEFNNKDKRYNHILHIINAAPAILEILSLRAASINKITPLVKSLPWLSKKLMTLVNKPQYRKRADVQVTQVNLALSYIGLDNLQLLIPTYVLKHLLPKATSPFGLLKRNLWHNSISIALASKVLAEQEGLDGFTAFTTGMLTNIGNLTVTSCVFESYNEVYKKQRQEAYDNKDKRLHNLFVDIDMPPDLLLEHLLTRSNKVSADLVELMGFDRLAITEPLFDLAYAYKLKDMHPIAQIVAKAKAYIAYRTLAKKDLIAIDEAKALLSKVRLTPANIALLKYSDIDHIKLKFYEKSS